jgi:hypothetical protein
MIQTYKISNKFKNFSLFNSNKFSWIYGFSFLKTLNVLLNKKNIIVTKKTLNIVSNSFFLDLELFFLTNKISIFRKKLLLLNDIKNNSIISTFFFKQFKLFKINSIFFNFNVLNLKIKKSIVFFFFKKLKKSGPLLFSRRFSFFLDFIKILSLFSTSQISAHIFLLFLQKIFKNLTKKNHNQFLSFLKTCFTLLIYGLKSSNSIKGIKLLINGKLKGKPRSDSTLILVGNVSNQTLDSKIDFSKIHVYTVYGVFGLKLWVSY